MKSLLYKAAVATALMAFVSLTSCDDKGDGDSKPYSELVGSYSPISVPVDNGAGTINDPYLTVFTTWKDPANIPTVDAGAILGMPPGSYMLPLNTVMAMMEAILSNMVNNGFVGFDLNNDGSFGVRYRNMIFSDNIMQDLLEQKFEETINTFPDATTSVLIPPGALIYSAQGGTFYITAAKEFLTQIGESQLDMDLNALIASLLGMGFKDLPIVDSGTHYSLTMPYVVEEGVLKIYLDREWLLPLKPLLDQFGGLLTPDMTVGIDVVDMMNKLFDNTSELEIAIRLRKAI